MKRIVYEIQKWRFFILPLCHGWCVVFGFRRKWWCIVVWLGRLWRIWVVVGKFQGGGCHCGVQDGREGSQVLRMILFLSFTINTPLFTTHTSSSHGAHRLTPSFSSMSMVLNDRGEIFLLHLNVGCLSSSDLHLNQTYCK